MGLPQRSEILQLSQRQEGSFKTVSRVSVQVGFHVERHGVGLKTVDSSTSAECGDVIRKQQSHLLLPLCMSEAHEIVNRIVRQTRANLVLHCERCYLLNCSFFCFLMLG